MEGERADSVDRDEENEIEGGKKEDGSRGGGGGFAVKDG